MPINPHPPFPPGWQQYDELLTEEDLPEGWYLPSRFPGERDDDASAEIDMMLGYNDWAAAEEAKQYLLESEQNETIDGRWRYIEHVDTHTRVFIRLQRQTFAMPEEVRITGVVYLPWRPGDPITSQLLRALPTARIEAAINKRLFAMKREETLVGGRIVLPSGHRVSRRELMKPIGDPKKVTDFYERVALQHGELTRKGFTNPTGEMAFINGVPVATAKGWVTRARARGLLPPGRRGRPG